MSQTSFRADPAALVLATQLTAKFPGKYPSLVSWLMTDPRQTSPLLLAEAMAAARNLIAK